MRQALVVLAVRCLPDRALQHLALEGVHLPEGVEVPGLAALPERPVLEPRGCGRLRRKTSCHERLQHPPNAAGCQDVKKTALSSQIRSGSLLKASCSIISEVEHCLNLDAATSCSSQTQAVSAALSDLLLLLLLLHLARAHAASMRARISKPETPSCPGFPKCIRSFVRRIARVTSGMHARVFQVIRGVP